MPDINQALDKIISKISSVKGAFTDDQSVLSQFLRPSTFQEARKVDPRQDLIVGKGIKLFESAVKPVRNAPGVKQISQFLKPQNQIEEALNYVTPGVGSIESKVAPKLSKTAVKIAKNIGEELDNLINKFAKNPTEAIELEEAKGFLTDPKLFKKAQEVVDLYSKREVPEKFLSKPSSPLAQGKTYYHGSNKSFDDFDFSLTGKSSGEKPLHDLKGSWFVDNKTVAKGYGKNVKDVKLDTSDFLTVDAKGKRLNDFRDELWDAKKRVRDEGKRGLVVKNLIDNADYSKSDIGDHVFVVDKSAIKSPTLAQEVGKKKSSVDEIYERLDKYIVKSKDYGRGDLKKLTLADYPFTAEAKKLIKEYADVKNKSAKYEGKKPPYEAGNEQGKGKDGKDEIEILKADSNSVVHEFFHTFAQHSPSFKGFKQEFQKAYDKLKPSFEPAQIIDTVLAKDKKNYPDKFRKYDTEERWAYLGEVYSGGGLKAFPESLRQFYKEVIL